MTKIIIAAEMFSVTEIATSHLHASLVMSIGPYYFRCKHDE